MNDTTLNNLKAELIKNNTISAAYYSQFDVKRGLRNADGSGVLAGLTHISSVIGSKKSENGLLPVEGILKYRGVSLADIVAGCEESKTHHFERTCFLLLVGRLPDYKEEKAFSQYMAKHREVPQEIIDNIIIGIPSKDIMNKLQTSISALYAFDDDADSLDPAETFFKSIRLIAKLPSIVALSYLTTYKPKAEIVKPTEKMSQAEAFLHILSSGKNSSAFDAYIVDLALVLHCEHGGGNNSTFTTYVVSSSGSDLYSSLAAAVASLKGPLHGAANKKVMDMMADIKQNVSQWENVDEIKDYLTKLVKKESGDKSGKLYGLGHAVYTKSDPRAIAIKSIAKRIADQNNRSKEYNLYNLIAEVGPSVFQNVKNSQKVISPNVDFYSGFVYDCLAIPKEIFTPIFAMARATGWCAHRIEDMLSGKRIIRPGYKYVDPK
jgi:citrate synthase